MNCLLFSADELNERLAAAVTSYGVGTRSYNKSAEKREMDRQRAEATAAYESQPHAPELLELLCGCRSFRFPHKPSVHRTLRADYDWRLPEERGATYSKDEL